MDVATRPQPSITDAGCHLYERPRWTMVDGSPGFTVQAGDLVIDGGGHVGESALTLLASRVVTVEPDFGKSSGPQRNDSVDIATGRVTVVPKASMTVFRALQSVNGASVPGHSVEHGTGGKALPVTMIDSLVRELQLQRVDLIKLAERWEVPAIRGAADTILRFSSRISVTPNHGEHDLRAIKQTVLACNRRVCVAFPVPRSSVGHRFEVLFRRRVCLSSSDVDAVEQRSSETT